MGSMQQRSVVGMAPCVSSCASVSLGFLATNSPLSSVSLLLLFHQ